MARAIVRCSFDDDYGSAARNAVAIDIFEREGWRKIGTLSYDTEHASVDAILAVVGKIITRLRNLPGQGTLDHVWIYVDDSDSATPESN